jgi:hypothetical protein
MIFKKILSNEVLDNIRMLVWGVVGSLIVLTFYHLYFSNPVKIGVIDIDGIFKTKVLQLREKYGAEEKNRAQIASESNKFWSDMEVITNQISKEYEVIILPTNTVITGENYNFTPYVEQKLGLSATKHEFEEKRPWNSH